MDGDLCGVQELLSINSQDLIHTDGGEHYLLNDVFGTLSDLELPADHDDEQTALDDNADLMMTTIPTHWAAFPNLDPVQTDYDFDIHIDPGEKINWLYSAKLEKVYIKLNSTMNLTVSHVPQMPGESLFVRAMIVFCRPEETHLPVIRCPNHRMLSNDIPSFHILKCCNLGTFYNGEESGSAFGGRASLIIPLQPTNVSESGRCSQSLGLEFLCQNSCANGIQRRQTALVLTLENQRKEILGKQLMHFKVCSCPKRDMSKEMNTAAPARKRTAHSPPSGSGKHPSKMLCVRPPGSSLIAAVKPEPESPPAGQFEQPQLAARTFSAEGFGKTESPDTLPMASPTDESAGEMETEGGAALSANGSDLTAGGFRMDFMMPDRESAQRMFRLAHNEIGGLLLNAKKPKEQTKLLSYVRHLRQYGKKNNFEL